MGFAQAWWLLAGALVLAVIGGYLYMQRRTRRHTLRFANLDLLDKVAPRRPGRWRHLSFSVLAVGLLLLVIAMAGPTANARVPRDRATVMLVVDVSLSMEATDVTPDRLDAAKLAATQFVQGLPPGINLGVESFAGIVTVLVTPTTDRAAATAAISGLKLDERTATGDALASALQVIATFSKTIGASAADPIPARIVLMTDGKQTVGRDELTVAAQAKQQGVPISVIAFGTNHGTVTINGTVEPVPLDTTAMQQVAQISGGDFHTAASASELQSVYAELGSQIGYTTQRKDESRPWLIAGALVSMLGAALAVTMSGRIP